MSSILRKRAALLRHSAAGWNKSSSPAKMAPLPFTPRRGRDITAASSRTRVRRSTERVPAPGQRRECILGATTFASQAHSWSGTFARYSVNSSPPCRPMRVERAHAQAHLARAGKSAKKPRDAVASGGRGNPVGGGGTQSGRKLARGGELEGSVRQQQRAHAPRELPLSMYVCPAWPVSQDHSPKQLRAPVRIAGPRCAACNSLLVVAAGRNGQATPFAGGTATKAGIYTCSTQHIQGSLAEESLPACHSSYRRRHRGR